MKLRYVILTALLVVATLVFAACEHKLTELELLQQRYIDIQTATSIEQSITIKKGNFTQFESLKTYTKTVDGYSVTGNEKKLNVSGSDQMYSVTQIDAEVDNAREVNPTLKLDESYFEEGYRLTETGLTATIKSGNIKDVFGVTDAELKAPTSDLTLELSVLGEHLSTVRITYVSEGSNVTIVLTMDY